MTNIEDIIASYGWNIKYNTFNINLNIPFSRQLDELNEDLLQASKETYVIDIGWYPERDPSGKIITVLFEKYNFDKPIAQYKDTNYLYLEDHIKYLLNLIKSKNGGI